MANTIIIKINQLIPLEDNPFEDLEKQEFEDLKANIAEVGMHEKPIVWRDNGYYRILSGNNRYRVATELGWKEIECVLYEGEDPWSVVFDSNIYRRHILSGEKRKTLLKQRELRRDEYLQKTIFSRLISGLTELYTTGKICLSAVIKLSKLDKNEQQIVVESYEKAVLVEVQNEEDKAKVKALETRLDKSNKEIQELRNRLFQKEKALEELRETAKELNEHLHEKVEDALENANKVISKNFEKDIVELNKNLVEMSKTMELKQAENKALKEEIERYGEKMKTQESEIKIREWAVTEEQKKVIEKQKEVEKKRLENARRYASPELFKMKVDCIVNLVKESNNHITDLPYESEAYLEFRRKGEELLVNVKALLQNIADKEYSVKKAASQEEQAAKN